MTNASKPQLRSPHDVLGTVPYLLGYHPADSIVTLYVASSGRVLACTNIALHVPTSDAVDKIRDFASRADAELVFIVGYGPLTEACAVTAVADEVDRHVPVGVTWLVSAGYYHCLVRGCGCGALGGVPFDPRATEVAAQAAVRGEVALPSRDDLLALVDPDPTAQAAVDQAIQRMPTLHSWTAADLNELLERAMLDQRLTDNEAARMGLLLQHIPLRDAAWEATSREMWQRNLWLDLTRRLPQRYVPAPAALAAWCAWMRGENPLALAAARRARRADPSYSMLQLVVTSILSNIPPSQLVPVWPMPHEPHDADQA
ncbi:DUF4192 domain-containing protein [Dactylosporangium sp. CA-233914]|uniref:DUF4192 domain-containing protein n=1 Tax=Dactylosporangium sp. CA-233914 TaxID=3239934 RepID=UPI003D93753B